MPPSILCPRHGHTASVLACEHIGAAASLGTELPAYRRVRVAVDHAGTVACCACFACANQFELASEIRAFADAEADKFPKFDSICTTCLEQTRSSPAADLAAMRSESANSRAQSSVRPIQVTLAVLLLCFLVGRGAVSLVLSLMHRAPVGIVSLGTHLSGAIWVVIDAFLIYGIWTRQSRARDIKAVLFGVSMLLYFLIPDSTNNPLIAISELIALCLLYFGPGAIWFAAEL